jgi:hypothetical protein
MMYWCGHADGVVPTYPTKCFIVDQTMGTYICTLTHTLMTAPLLISTLHATMNCVRRCCYMYAMLHVHIVCHCCLHVLAHLCSFARVLGCGLDYWLGICSAMLYSGVFQFVWWYMYTYLPSLFHTIAWPSMYLLIPKCTVFSILN